MYINVKQVYLDEKNTDLNSLGLNSVIISVTWEFAFSEPQVLYPDPWVIIPTLRIVEEDNDNTTTKTSSSNSKYSVDTTHPKA